MPPTIFVAYDASINAEWVTRYAIRLASRTPDRRLRLVAVEDGTVRERDLSDRLARVERACADAETILDATVVPSRGSVVETLLAAVPAGPGSLLCCGTRARDAGRGLLWGTVSARLLQQQHCETLAIRVVSPGLLGAPRRILYALSQNPKSVGRAVPFLDLLAGGVEELSLLTVMEAGRLAFGGATATAHPQLLAEGRAYLEAQVEQLRQRLRPPVPRIDPHVCVSHDVPGQIVRHAARVQAQLLLVGATERSLPRRLVFGSPLEHVLEAAPCDVAIFREAKAG